MNSFKRIITASATLLAAVLALLPASAEAKIDPTAANRKARYEATIDSLKAEIARLNDELALRDSLSGEFMDIYEEHDGSAPRFYDVDVADSLVDIWYLHQSIDAEEEEGEYPMDSVRFTSNVPDSVYVARLTEMNSFITLPYNDIVKNYIILYSEKMPNKIGKIIGLCRYYIPLFDEILNEYDLPEELGAMAVIESSLNPLAVSRAGAKGMWQFMYRTAKLYGLYIDSFVDERMDPEASARAAARYLRDSYEMFGDWSLAIASYNCGAGNVNKAIRRSGGKTGFWDIYPYLPRETRGYVPAFVGALYTMHYYKEHGITPEAAGLAPVVDTFRVNKMLHFGQVRDLVGVPIEDLRNLNPQYRHDIVPGNEREFTVKIPHSYVNNWLSVEDTLYSYKADEFFNPVNLKKIKDGGDGERIVYKVRSGDALSKIAQRYHVSVTQIKRWNNLSSNNIRIGQNLVIYRGGGGPATTSTSTSTSTSKSQSAPSSSAKTSTSSSSSNSNAAYTVYTVRSGDSLYLIAKKYPGVSAQNIMDYNHISSSKIKPGMKLKIPKVR